MSSVIEKSLSVSQRVGIFAHESSRGGLHITVMPLHISNQLWMTNCRLAACGGDVKSPDWQASAHPSLADAKSALMRFYGIGWFNRARKQLAAIAKAENTQQLSDDRPGGTSDRVPS